MVNIFFYTNTAGTKVAKWPGTSQNTEKGSRKGNQFYLGKVINRDKLIFYKREEGYYHFDPNTLQKEPILPEDIPKYVKPVDQRIHAQMSICIFGGSYFLDKLIIGIEYNKVLRSIPFRNTDTLNTMLQYYLLSPASDMHAELWYQNSYAHFIYPKANIASQRLSEFYTALGKPDVRRAFLDNHISYVKSATEDEFYVMIDSTGCPNSIGIPITRYSRHENDVNIEFRVIVVIQKSTGLPIYYDIIPGNIVDISTIHNVIRKLGLMGCKIHYIIGDAGYNCPSVMERLVFEGIEFMTRMNPTYDLYEEILKTHYDELVDKSSEHVVEYKGRMVKVLKIPSVIGKNKNTGEDLQGFVYLCRDLQAYQSKADHIMNSKEYKQKPLNERLALLDKLGIFAIVATMDLPEEEVLPSYYTRQAIEQFFDYIKNYGKLTPIRKHTLDTVNGHVLLSFIAAFLAVLIKNRLNIIDLPYVAIPSKLNDEARLQEDVFEIEDEDGTKRELILCQDSLQLGYKPSPEMLFHTLQLYCAEIWDEEIVPAVAIKEVKDFYYAFGLHIPETVLRKSEALLPILKDGEKDTCTKIKAFSKKPILTDAQIIAKREAAEAKRLEKLAKDQGKVVVYESEISGGGAEDHSNESQEQSQPKRRGRPLGSKNKKTLEREAQEKESPEPHSKRGRGRPLGSKNKAKHQAAGKTETKKRGRPLGSKDKTKRKKRSDAKNEA